MAKKEESETKETEECENAINPDPLNPLIEAGRMALEKTRSPRERMMIEEALQQLVAKQDRRRERRLH
jgi:hypothetical protein